MESPADEMAVEQREEKSVRVGIGMRAYHADRAATATTLRWQALSILRTVMRSVQLSRGRRGV